MILTNEKMEKRILYLTDPEDTAFSREPENQINSRIINCTTKYSADGAKKTIKNPNKKEKIIGTVIFGYKFLSKQSKDLPSLIEVFKEKDLQWLVMLPSDYSFSQEKKNKIKRKLLDLGASEVLDYNAGDRSYINPIYKTFEKYLNNKNAI